MLRGLGLMMVAVPVVGVTAAVSYRAARWSGNSDAARAVAGDPSMPFDDRAAAMAGAHRDARATIHMLQLLAREPGPIGAHAAELLRSLR